MLDDLFRPYGFTITRAGSSVATILSYRIKCSSISYDESFNWLASDSLETTLKGVTSKFLSVLLNGGKLIQGTVYHSTVLSEFIDNLYVSLTPQGKLDSVLEYMGKWAKHDGQAVILKEPLPTTYLKMYFVSMAEWRFYLRSVISMGYIERKSEQPIEQGSQAISKYNLTINGLSHLIKVTEGKASRYCFVAMAFTNDMDAVYKNSIEPAITKTGFIPYIVNNIDVDSDKTINDAILAGIKKAKFTIADFTHHRGGVYFEAGYALGRGQKVIYTCRVDEMNKAHFDIRNYQHIVWTDEEDLRIKLINKIEAFIKD